MDVYTCITERRSCRAFLADQVAKKTVENILEAANRSPSYMNSQPWEVFAVMGEKKDALSQKLYAKAVKREPVSPDLAFPQTWPDLTARHIEDHRLHRFEALGINPNDKERVREQFLRNFKFFDAPCVVFIGADKKLTAWSIFDLGSFVYGLLLSAQAEGLGACPQAVPLSYPGVIREELGISGELQLILAVALGYPHPAATVNCYRSTRRSLKEFTHWHGF